MGCFRSFQNASVIAKIILFILMLNVALAWTSFVTASWGDSYVTASNSLAGYGLWRRCGNSETTPNCENLLGWNLQWYRAVQAFAILGFVSVNISFLLVLFLIFNSECVKSKTLSLWLSVLGFWAAVCYILAIIIFGAKFDSSFTTSQKDQELEYGWGLAIAVALLEVIVGVLMLVESMKTGAKFMDL